MLTTVGLGDLAPTTALSKLFTIGYVLVGIGVILAFVDRLVREQRDVRGPLRHRLARATTRRARTETSPVSPARAVGRPPA